MITTIAHESDCCKTCDDNPAVYLLQKYQCISAVKTSSTQYHCNVCQRTLSCAHQGEADVKRHLNSEIHKKFNKQLDGQKSMPSIFAAIKADTLPEKVIRAEVKMAVAVANHNIPLSFTNHLSPLMADIFPDSQIAKKYASAATKTTCIINGALAPYFLKELIEIMTSTPFSLLVDGSNDTGLEKMNPLTVRIFDVASSTVHSRLLDMCCTTGPSSATAAAIFDKINSVMTAHAIPWSNCVGFGVDNTSVNIGRNNSIMTRVITLNPACYFMGCPCHLVHNVACRASGSLAKQSGFDVEDMCVDVFFYFEHSTKRKSLLAEFSDFCDIKYRKIVKHVNTRWLSLETAVQRMLDMFPATQSYFLSNSESIPRFKRLKELFSSPMSEIYLLFYHAVLPTFTTLNKYLQREDPCLYAAHDHINGFMKRLLAKFLPLDAVKLFQQGGQFNFEAVGDQLPNEDIFIGFTTKQKLDKLFNEGDISPTQKACFFEAVRSFYTTAVKEGLAKLPINDHFLIHAKFVDFFQREQALFGDVQYFVSKFEKILSLSPADVDKLQEEFTDYQLLQPSQIPQSIWDSAVVKLDDDNDMLSHDPSCYRMDVIWGYIAKMQLPDGSLKFPKLGKIAKTVLVIPHSNAGEERVFSMIRKNKTAFRPSLQVDGTLSSLINIKLANQEPCFQFEPSKDLLKTAKSATWNYNKQHSTSQT
jgi:hypothetical protein